MSDLFAVAGAKIFIGSAAMAAPTVDVIPSDFAAVAWTEISDWTQCGSIGDAAQLITTQVISQSRDKKQKGTRNAGSMQNVFAINSSDPGQIAVIAAEKTGNNYPFKIEWNDAPGGASFPVAITIASPGVITKTAHGLTVGRKVKFSTTGALPTGLTAGVEYYVKTVPDADTFQVSATPTGTAIATTGTQNGTHTVIVTPIGTVNYFIGLVMSAQQAGGGANTVRSLNATVEVNSNLATVQPSA
ncbi:hypothetical protein [Pseudaminobacter soli (ex Li et al. 2025)]|uniref:Phage tail protein n=1 Tax=Pseudaminobacter soli (ex Li et al. 2025) TaxID=1295366 RepID=A0A2P7SEF8_9HYPH|nr:hypothetical protein [Mesorhizobium soli]PSJ60745.1 hypothetical protein C7I85_11930 [Mesorhizobium soli]